MRDQASISSFKVILRWGVIMTFGLCVTYLILIIGIDKTNEIPELTRISTSSFDVDEIWDMLDAETSSEEPETSKFISNYNYSKGVDMDANLSDSTKHTLFADLYGSGRVILERNVDSAIGNIELTHFFGGGRG